MQGVASERGCFSTTSCSRHPQTPLDATLKEREGGRGRWRRQRRLADHKSPKLVSNRPLCSFLSSTFWPLRPGYTRTHTHTRVCFMDAGYTRRRVGFEGVTSNSVQGHGKKRGLSRLNACSVKVNDREGGSDDADRIQINGPSWRGVGGACHVCLLFLRSCSRNPSRVLCLLSLCLDVFIQHRENFNNILFVILRIVLNIFIMYIFIRSVYFIRANQGELKRVSSFL